MNKRKRKPKLKGTGVYFSPDRRTWIMSESGLTLFAKVDVQFHTKDGRIVGVQNFTMPMDEEMVAK